MQSRYIPILVGLMLLANPLIQMSSATDECGTGRLFRTQGMVQLLFKEGATKYRVPVQAKGGVSHVSMSVPQRKDNNEQSRASGVTAPGGDPSRFVPGTSVDAFSLSDYFRLGVLRFRPSIRVTYLYRSHLVADGSEYHIQNPWQIAPTIELLLPISKNGVRFDYTIIYDRYKNLGSSYHISHIMNMDSKVDLSPIASVSVRDHFAASTLNAREFVPGREIIYSDSNFKRNDLETQMDWQISEDTNLGITGDYNTTWFEKSPTLNQAPMYDYRQYQFGGFLRRNVNQRISLHANGGYLRNIADDPRGLSSSKGFEALGGIESVLTPLISGQVSVGYRREDYGSLAMQDFSGLVLRGNLQKEISEVSRLSFAATRITNLSNFEHNPYYLTTGLGMTYMRDMSRQLVFSVTPEYQRNAYPTPLETGLQNQTGSRDDLRRLDRIYDLAVDVRYRHNSWMAFDFQFGALRRRSNVPNLSFTDYRISISLLAGIRGITQGRTPY